MTFLLCAKCGFKPRSSDSLKLQLKVMKHHIEHWNKLTDGKLSVTTNNRREPVGYLDCPICNMGFRTPFQLSDHIRRDHKEEQRHARSQEQEEAET